jgi:hypothetical protein
VVADNQRQGIAPPNRPGSARLQPVFTRLLRLGHLLGRVAARVGGLPEEAGEQFELCVAVRRRCLAVFPAPVRLLNKLFWEKNYRRRRG